MAQIIQNFSSKLISLMDRVHTRSELENIRLTYGIQLVFHNICMLTLILTTAAFAGTFKETLIMFCVFGSLRYMAGGLHLNKSLQCVLATGAIVVGGAKISQLIRIDSLTVTILFLLCILIACLYAPSGTKNNPINPKFRARMKRRAIGLLIIYYFISMISDTDIRELFTIASACEMITIIPYLNHKYNE